MRLALASLIALSGLAPAVLAQTTAPPETPAPAPAAAPSAAEATGPAAATPAPATTPAAPPAAATPAPAAGATSVPTPTAAAPAPEAAPTPAAETPPAPPPPPTDPAAIGLISTLETVCIPLVDGGDINKLTKAAGFRKSGDNYVLKQKTYQLTVEAQGSNPSQCHVDIIHPVDPEAPAKPIVVALHNWAAVTRGWTLYRNDKNVEAGEEFTTRSWENDADGRHMGLVLTTIRKADGTPAGHGSDTSEMIYSAIKTGG
jgi:hypothetical protein